MNALIPILLVFLLAVTFLGWAIFNAGCKHENVKGIANYYDHDLKCFVHLKGCEDCGESIITWER